MTKIYIFIGFLKTLISLIQSEFLNSSCVVKSQYEIFQACEDLDHIWCIVLDSTWALVW